jgi:hypothetical protein
MEWIIGIACSLFGVFAGFCLDRLWGWQQKRKSGLIGDASRIVTKLGAAVKSFEGYYFVAESPTDNYKIANHFYQNAIGEIIATSFRENPASYGERDLARNLPNGGSNFTRISTSKICSTDDEQRAKNALDSILPGASLIVLPEGLFITSIDGIYCKLTDGTYLTFVTFPKTGDQHKNRGILFYGHIAKSFFDYYQDLKEAYKSKK